MRVLFTGGGGAGTTSLWQQLSPQYDVHFADAQPDRIPPVIPSAHRHPVPMAGAVEFIPELRRLVADLNIDLLVPGVDEELLPIARHRAELAGCQVLLPGATEVERCLDKLAFTEAAAERGLRVPHTQRLDQVTRWESFPCIAKPRTGRGSAGLMTLSDESAINGWRAVVADPAAVIVQERILGTEYTVQVISDADANLRAIVPVLVRSKRGITVSAVTDAHPSVITECQVIHEVLGTSGVVNVQGILDGDGQFWTFEVNPRVSTTLCLVIASGVDPLALYNPASMVDVSLAPFIDGLPMERFWDTQIPDATSIQGGRVHG